MTNDDFYIVIDQGNWENKEHTKHTAEVIQFEEHHRAGYYKLQDPLSNVVHVVPEVCLQNYIKGHRIPDLTDSDMQELFRAIVHDWLILFHNS